MTEVSEAPVMEAVKAADWPFVIEIQLGLTDILTSGFSVTVAERAG